jgi:hypothetical protein
MADCRGMHASTRGMRRAPESTVRRGMHASTRGMRARVRIDRPPRHAPRAQLTIPDATFVACPPNGLAFSCRERAGSDLQKINDLARAAVNCNAGLGGAGGPIPSQCDLPWHVPRG